MRIGIDFDNTIVRYDKLFRAIAIKKKIISDDWKGQSKKSIRNYLRQKEDGEKIWMKLQGQVYGRYMHLAELMPGVSNFLFVCNHRGYKVFIVSHKTEFGHYDSDRVSLRVEAVKWMQKKGFFKNSHFGLNEDNIYFASTREKKVSIISELDCEWFVDDLPEVFNESHFPKSTKKILFGCYESSNIDNGIILNNWSDISYSILGHYSNDDVALMAKNISNFSLKNIEKISGRGNSMVYKILDEKNNNFVLKIYPDLIVDSRLRLEVEFSTLELLHKHGFADVPKPVNKNDELNIGLYEWCKGDEIKNPDKMDIDHAIQFVKRLYDLSKKLINKNGFYPASEACLSMEEVVFQIENRLNNLKKYASEYNEMIDFLDHTLIPIWERVKNYSFSLWPKESITNNLAVDKQILSPSDFGFHNCLKSKNGSLIFLDFDYFGWDDPVKLVADFIWHPGMNLEPERKKQWRSELIYFFSKDKSFENRLLAAMPIYGIRWVLIILNEYLPSLAKKRRDAIGKKNYNFKNSQKIQLEKARKYINQVESILPQFVKS